MRVFFAILSVAVAVSAAAQSSSSSFQLHGFLSGREIYVKAQPSWTADGVGRFDVGAANPDSHRNLREAVAQVGADWLPLGWLAFHVDGLARTNPAGTKGSRAGLVQAYGDIYSEHLALRLGSFWLPTSRENVDPLWSSPYTITYSALNSWIANEVRPIGADLQFSPNFYMTFGATAFRGNDTMGTELAAHGWSFGNRISVYNENLPLPDGETTRPIGRDLDSKNGYSGRIRLQMPERALIQLTHVENRATLVPYVGDQSPWRTRFDVLGGSIGASGPTTLAAEYAKGSTAVAFPGGTYKMDFDTAYVLLSDKRGSQRFTIRAERFTTRSHIATVNDAGREHGTAYTVAWFQEPDKRFRSGVEYMKVKGDRPGVATDGFDPRTGGSTLTVEVRYGF